MARRSLSRLRLSEYRPVENAVSDAADRSGTPNNEVAALLRGAGERLARELGFKASPLQVDGDRVVVSEVAGLLRVSRGIELEVAPKFLSPDADRWREDFFLLATLSRYGKLLAREELGSSYAARGDLATLVARSLAAMYASNRRRSLRVYRRVRWRNDALDGEADEEDLVMPDPLGIPQQGLRLSKDNGYNATILKAVEVLLPEVRELDTRRQLLQVYRDLRPQSLVPQRGKARFPSRHRGWRPVFELSQQVIAGFGTSLKYSRAAIAPGYVLKTAKLWEDTVFRALRAGLSPLPVLDQRAFRLGQRARSPLNVTPDVAVNATGQWYLADAKYKGRWQKSVQTVDAADVYESLAFLRAAGARAIVLFYPDDSGHLKAGEWQEFDRVTVESQQVIGVRLGVVGVSLTGGIRRLGAGTADAFQRLHGRCG